MRLIDADALLKTHCNECTLYPNDCLGDGCDNGAAIHIKEAPTVDAVPVRRGKWTADEILYTQGMTACSCCKTEYYRDDLYMVGNDAHGELPNYCPNCGARMDKE